MCLLARVHQTHTENRKAFLLGMLYPFLPMSPKMCATQIWESRTQSLAEEKDTASAGLASETATW